MVTRDWSLCDVGDFCQKFEGVREFLEVAILIEIILEVQQLF
jgi:hypothetical protein